MRTGDPQDRPSEAEFERLIATAHVGINRTMRIRRRGPGWGRRVVAGALAGLVIAGGGAAVANVGPFKNASTPSSEFLGECEHLKGPVDMDGRPSTVDLCAVTDTPWRTNEFGLTVGSPTRADVAMRSLPDLMPVAFRDGPSGFWRSEEVYLFSEAGEVKSPPRDPTLYEADGVTLVRAEGGG